MVRSSKVPFRLVAEESGSRRRFCSDLSLDSVVRQVPAVVGLFTQLSKTPDERHRHMRRSPLQGSVRIYGLVVPTSAARRSATLLILSRKGAIFDRSERLRSSKYEA